MSAHSSSLHPGWQRRYARCNVWWGGPHVNISPTVSASILGERSRGRSAGGILHMLRNLFIFSSYCHRPGATRSPRRSLKVRGDDNPTHSPGPGARVAVPGGRIPRYAEYSQSDSLACDSVCAERSLKAWRRSGKWREGATPRIRCSTRSDSRNQQSSRTSGESGRVSRKIFDSRGDAFSFPIRWRIDFHYADAIESVLPFDYDKGRRLLVHVKFLSVQSPPCRLPLYAASAAVCLLQGPFIVSKYLKIASSSFD